VRKHTGGGFFEGCETTLRESVASPTSGVSGKPEAVGGSAGWKRSGVSAGTRCNSLETSARRKPSRWGSNHEDGTSGSGGTGSPKEGQPSGSGRAPETSAQAPSERTRGGDSAAAGVPAGTRDIPVQPTGGRAAMRGGPPADPPGIGATRTTGPAEMPDDTRVSSRPRFRHLSGEKSSDRGAYASTACRRECGSPGVVPRSKTGV